MKIVIDAYGGDNAPQEIVKGALQALKEKEGFSVVLVGKREEIEALLTSETYDADRVGIVDARDVITNDMSPTEAVRKMKDSSLVKAFSVLNSDPEAQAIISAGSTGAVLTGATLLVKRLEGVTRAALAPVISIFTPAPGASSSVTRQSIDSSVPACDVFISPFLLTM